MVAASPRLWNSPRRARAAKAPAALRAREAGQPSTERIIYAPPAPGSVSKRHANSRQGAIAVSLPVTIRDRYLMQSMRGSRAIFFS
jgi:hypothetical protein